jgi:hypothetical protein
MGFFVVAAERNKPFATELLPLPLHFSTRSIAVRRAWSTPSAASFRMFGSTSATLRLRLRPRSVGTQLAPKLPLHCVSLTPMKRITFSRVKNHPSVAQRARDHFQNV